MPCSYGNTQFHEPATLHQTWEPSGTESHDETDHTMSIESLYTSLFGFSCDTTVERRDQQCDGLIRHLQDNPMLPIILL
ncbi:hypothetical protein ANCCAN_27849 [Ancylostoma caninum]|uniref:Uncharacterized protein n=1 Tax=Ancylostoma caninum TaxID=29170 RepID=A0A368F2U9_ANCCA|nr:hypothetical protein ANCCAN_27849 [Ancylostoma caninum]